MMLPSRLAIASLLLLSATAHAAPVPHTERILTDPALVWQADPEAADLTSRTIYLNRCRGGCVIHAGQESAGANTSSILSVGVGNFSEFKYGDDEWNQVVQCVRETYAPFNIKVVTDRPSSGVY